MFLIGHVGGSIHKKKITFTFSKPPILRLYTLKVIVSSWNPRAKIGNSVHDSSYIFGVNEYLSQVDPCAIDAWYCMHVEICAMLDKSVAFHWLANDVLRVRIDVRVPSMY